MLYVCVGMVVCDYMCSSICMTVMTVKQTHFVLDMFFNASLLSVSLLLHVFAKHIVH